MTDTKNLNLTQVRRISLLLAFLKRNPYKTKEEILDYFEENDKGFNERTLYRLNQTLSRDFGIEIVFDYNYDGYYFDEDKSTNPEAFLSLLEILVTAELFSTNFKEKNNALSYVEFENRAAIETLPNFKTVLNAIQLQLPINFNHHSFYHLKEEMYTLKLTRYFVLEKYSRIYSSSNLTIPTEFLSSKIIL